MNEVHPETDVIQHSDIQNDEEEKLAALKYNLKKKQTSYANKELEKMDQELTKLKIRMGIKDYTGENSGADSYKNFLIFKNSEGYQKFLTKLETHHKLELDLVEKRQKLIELDGENQNLDDRKEFFEFLRDEKQFGERRKKIKTLENKKEEDTFIAHQIFGKQSKLEAFLEKQTKNVTFMNSMIKKTGLYDQDAQIESAYQKFEIDQFRDRLAEVRNECEKYIDPFDLSLALKGKKTVKTLMDELNIDYLENSNQKKSRAALLSQTSLN